MTGPVAHGKRGSDVTWTYFKEVSRKDGSWQSYISNVTRSTELRIPQEQVGEGFSVVDGCGDRQFCQSLHYDRACQRD